MLLEYQDNDAEEEIPEGQSIEAYLSGLFDRNVYNCARSIVTKPLADSFEAYKELTMKQIRLIMSAYSGKKIENDDDDDGIEGEEDMQRHTLFDSTFSAISLVKDGVLNKAGVARAFRALADFYERMVETDKQFYTRMTKEQNNVWIQEKTRKQHLAVLC